MINSSDDLIEGLTRRLNRTHALEAMFTAFKDHGAIICCVLERMQLRIDILKLLYPRSNSSGNRPV